MTTRNAGKNGRKNGARKKASAPAKQEGQVGTHKEPTALGTNRTGAGTAPIRTARAAAGARSGGALPDGFQAAHADVYRSYEAEREPIGTMPPPTRIRGAVKMLADLATGKKGTVLLDKLGERLGFERTGTRLYDLLITKFEVQGSYDGGPTRAELTRIRNDELEHFQLLSDVLTELGADPTVLTPCADVSAVASAGLRDVLADPRTTLAQGLHAIHVAELTDRDGWEMLVELVVGMGHQELGQRFRSCAAREVEHLATVRRWLAAYAMEESGVAVGAS